MVVSKRGKVGGKNGRKEMKIKEEQVSDRRVRDLNNAEVLSIPSVEAGEIGAQVFKSY